MPGALRGSLRGSVEFSEACDPMLVALVGFTLRAYSKLPNFIQKNPFSVRKIRVRNSGAGNGCANFVGTWKKCVLSAGKPPCP